MRVPLLYRHPIPRKTKSTHTNINKDCLLRNMWGIFSISLPHAFIDCPNG